MGGDTNTSVRLVSFNSSRLALENMPRSSRPKYLERIINEKGPEICFLPGNDETIGRTIIHGYDQYLNPTCDGTVFLYDTNRVSMKDVSASVNGFGPLAGLEMGKLVFPEVTVKAPRPLNHVVKTFGMVSWNHTLYTDSKVDPEILTESLIIFSQRLSWQIQKPVLIGGEMTINVNNLNQIVKKLSQYNQELFLASVQPEMSKLGYLPSNTKSSLKDFRHLFMMKVYRCETSFPKPTEIVRTWNAPHQPAPVADCFIASKALELSEAKLLSVDDVISREIKLEPTKTCTETPTCTPRPVYTPTTAYRPTQTEIRIPTRPPAHHGG